MTEGDRLKQIRKNANMTQEEFAKRMGVTQSAIARIERNTNNVSEQMRKSICREFNVDPIWLSTGEGEMFFEQSLDSIEMLDKLLHTESKFANTMFKMFAKYTKEDWEDLERLVSKSAEYIKELDDRL
ncbi:MAG: helix-turn-helix transcriptional regulator [Lachnospiraceae bacterium]|nr:helix-turn-helix transcriptional regulator [Lachnospiraceae bacterium]MBO5144371.1 helix-turn-helix transcriptional regulator [Lachnospiraceae bacterium]